MADQSGIQPSVWSKASWVFAASVSLTTTKYLLDRRLHFPMHLLAMQLAATLVLNFIQWFVQKPVEHDRVQYTLRNSTTSRSRTIYLLLHIICVSISFVCGYQAILHTFNLPVLILIVSPNWLPMGLDTDNLTPSPWQTTRRRAIVLARSLLALLGMATLVLFDYRLSITSFVMIIITVGLMSLAEVLIHNIATEIDLSTAAPAQPLTKMPYMQYASIETCTLIGAFLATVVWCYFRERGFFRTFTAYNPLVYDIPVLALNLTSSSLALFMGGHIFKQWSSHRKLNDAEGDPASQLTMSISLAALVSIGSILCPPKLPYLISPWQWLAFAVASVTILPTSPTKDADYTLIIEELKPSIDSPSQAENVSERHSLINRVHNRVSRKTLLPLAAYLVLIALSWAVLSFHTTSFDRHPLPGPVLDKAFRPQSALDIVISRYHEPAADLAVLISKMLELPNIRHVEPTFRIYNKNQDAADSTVFLASLTEALTSLQQSPHLVVTSLPNIGREADTYLEHITTRWDNLANHTIFTQADPHFQAGLTRLLRDSFVPDTGFLSLSVCHTASKGYCTSCDDCYDRDWTEDPALLHELYRDFNHGRRCGDVLLTYRGQFVASAARIRGNVRQVYGKWLQELRRPGGRLHAPPYTQGKWSWKPDSLSAPRVGFTLERTWAAMMQCNERRIAERCPSHLSSVVCPEGLCRTPKLEDCQCLDS